jgi:hypothetical protein
MQAEREEQILREAEQKRISQTQLLAAQHEVPSFELLTSSYPSVFSSGGEDQIIKSPMEIRETRVDIGSSYREIRETREAGEDFIRKMKVCLVIVCVNCNWGRLDNENKSHSRTHSELRYLKQMHSADWTNGKLAFSHTQKMHTHECLVSEAAR